MYYCPLRMNFSPFLGTFQNMVSDYKLCQSMVLMVKAKKTQTPMDRYITLHRTTAKGNIRQ